MLHSDSKYSREQLVPKVVAAYTVYRLRYIAKLLCLTR